MRTQVKICGITNVADAMKSCELGADFLGLIFVSSSPRCVEESEAIRISAKLKELAQPEKTKLVGVFKDVEAEAINRICDIAGLDYIQCHGHETPQFCESLNRPVIKVLEICLPATGELYGTEQMEADARHLSAEIEKYSTNVEYFLFDRPKLPSTSLSRHSQWLETAVEILTKMDLPVPFFFAGGLDSENVNEPLYELQPFAIDVASGVESAPGKKDWPKLNKFFEQVKLYNSELEARTR